MNYNLEQNNVAKISGVVSKTPEISHQIEGENFLDFEVEVERLSLVKDTIPVTISERTLGSMDIKLGDKVKLSGQYRSHNKNINEKSKLILQFFAKDIERTNETQLNEVKLTGYICRPPIFRETPFKRQICDVLIAVNRGYRSDYIPCIVWGRNARFMSGLTVGTQVKVEGRIQSRKYNKVLADGSSEERTAYEVSCSGVSVQAQKNNDGIIIV